MPTYTEALKTHLEQALGPQGWKEFLQRGFPAVPEPHSDAAFDYLLCLSELAHGCMECGELGHVCHECPNDEEE